MVHLEAPPGGARRALVLYDRPLLVDLIELTLNTDDAAWDPSLVEQAGTEYQVQLKHSLDPDLRATEAITNRRRIDETGALVSSSSLYGSL